MPVFCEALLHAATVSEITVSPQSFMPAKGQIVALKFELNKPVTVDIRVFDSDWQLVAVVDSGKEYSAGSHEVIWDGIDMDGFIVPDEAYFFTIVGDGNETVYDPTTFSGGAEFDVTEATVDVASQTISYQLDQPSRILIRIGIAGGPLLRTLVNWEPRVVGHITEHWNGRDQDGVIDLTNNERARIVITGFELPDASVITYGNTELDYIAYKTEHSSARGAKQARPSISRPDIKISTHYRRDRRLDMPIDLFLEFPGIEPSKDGSVVIKDTKELVRVELAPNVKPLFLEEPFEISFFLDSEYYSEQEVGHTPYNWMWDVTSVAPGDHVLTVNVSSFKDIIGVRSCRVFIDR
ncbi:MAG: FlgD immunoglobulin-like domain containing protein [Candidatus Zixiibacteriota bacterium]